jgi:hypothetical protein
MATLDRPAVEYRTPTDLVRDVQRGIVRVPPFQRGFRWEPQDVAKLFDSLYRGYPIGNLLFWRHPAPAQSMTIGPVELQAPETDAALWVVDGQQRIISIVGALITADHTADPRFRIYLDLDAQEFRSAGTRQEPPVSWIPVSVLHDTVSLLRWIRASDGLLSDSHIEVADQAAKAIREYQIPTYVVSSDDEGTLIEIFTRMNNTGKPLNKQESFAALHSGMSGRQPTSMSSISQVPAELGFGRLDDRLVLRCLLAFRGGDIFREDFHDEFVSDEDRVATFREVAALLRDAVWLLQGEIGIPHLKLLPYSHVIPVLIRFLRIQGAPGSREVTLLRRWVWRSAVAGARARGISVVDIRRQVHAAESDTSLNAVLALLALVQPPYPFEVNLQKIHLNHAMSRINVLGLLSVTPRDLRSGQPIDVRPLLADGSPLRPILTDGPWPHGGSMANRIVSAPVHGSPVRDLLVAADPAVSESHLVDEAGQFLLAQGGSESFLRARAGALEETIKNHVDRMAEWGARDGRSISGIMRTVA